MDNQLLKRGRFNSAILTVFFAILTVQDMLGGSVLGTLVGFLAAAVSLRDFYLFNKALKGE